MRLGLLLVGLVLTGAPPANACIMPPSADMLEVQVPPGRRAEEAELAKQEAAQRARLTEQVKWWDRADRVLVGQFEQWATLTRKHPRRDRMVEVSAVELSAVKWLKGAGQETTFAVPSREDGPCGQAPWSAGWRGQGELVVLFVIGTNTSDNYAPLLLRVDEALDPRLLAALTAQ